MRFGGKNLGPDVTVYPCVFGPAIRPLTVYHRVSPYKKVTAFCLALTVANWVDLVVSERTATMSGKDKGRFKGGKVLPPRLPLLLPQARLKSLSILNG